MKKEERHYTFWKYVFLVMGSILILVPLLATVFSSFEATKDIIQRFLAFPNPITLSNHTHLLADGIGHHFQNSTIITVVSVTLVILFIPATAYSIVRNMNKKRAPNIMYSLLISGILVSFQVIMILIAVMMSRLGSTGIWDLVILYLTYTVPQTLFLYVGYIKLSVPESSGKAAEIDGADKFTTYRKVASPMLKSMHAAILIINTPWSWSDFILPLLILNKSSESRSLPPFQYNHTGQYPSDYGPSFASYVVSVITIIIVYLISQKHIISGMSNGAVK